MDENRLIRAWQATREWITTRVVRRILRVLVLLRVFRVTVTGRGRFPRSGAVIVVANHVSMLDGLYVWGAMRRRATALAMAEVWAMPIVGRLARWVRFVPVERGRKDSGAIALERLERCLRAGRAVIVFPEGRCAPPGETFPFRPGAAVLAVRTGAPIVPVGLVGTNDVLPLAKYARGKRIDLTRRVRVHVGDPIRPEEHDDVAALTAAVEARVRELSAA
ncbi:MAG: lysophospholipid acyltransferase family protein [Gordonia sp. (in: high G+C Gram-positive bacteria)]|uniref:lysophospholipid acyltransferase family protein n=1 Tax=Gordonia sp. (in: high G+C Gram-positive bacteria) TaxID=84139 RepID=UPI0039E27784